MPEDNFLDCVEVIAEIRARNKDTPGQWYGKCLLGYPVQFRVVSIVYRITKTKALTLSFSDQLRR